MQKRKLHELIKCVDAPYTANTTLPNQYRDANIITITNS